MGEARVEIMGGKIALVTKDIHWETARDMCKEIPGGRWDRHNHLWKYPLDFQVCRAIRSKTKRYGVKLEIGPELGGWAKAEKARLDAIPDPSEMDLVEIERLKHSFPEIWGAISTRPFQTVGVDFLAKTRRAVLADDPGLGKTIQSIASVANVYDSGLFLVIAPKSAAQVTWPAEIKRWLPNDDIIEASDIASHAPGAKRNAHIDQMFKRLKYGEGRAWFITSPYWLQVKADKDSRGEFKRDANDNIIKHPKLPDLFTVDWDGVIVDESHKVVICNTAKRSKHTQTRFGLDELRLSDNAIKLALSGTPMRGKAENMWGTLNWLEPKYYTSYWKWMSEHFHSFESDSDFGSGVIFDGLKDRGQFYQSMRHLFLRRTKTEVARDLPPKIYGGEPLDGDGPIAVWLELLPSQRKQYEAMEKMAETEEGIIANGILSEWTRLKQFAGAKCALLDGVVQPQQESNKLEWVLEFLDDRGIMDNSGENKVIIASQFSKMVDMFDLALQSRGVRTIKLTGSEARLDNKKSDRPTLQQEFQANPDSPKVFLLTTTAGGVSLTLDAADDVVILDETFIPDDQIQVEDRAHRLSRPDHNVTIWNLRSRGTIEEAIAKVTMGREGEVRGIMDESRGVKLIKMIQQEMEKDE